MEPSGYLASLDNIDEMMFLVKLCDGRCMRKHVHQLRLRHGEPNIEPAQVPLSPTPVLTPPAFEPEVFPHESFSPINVPELLPDPVPLIEKPTAAASKDRPPLALRRSARVCKPPERLDLCKKKK